MWKTLEITVFVLHSSFSSVQWVFNTVSEVALMIKPWYSGRFYSQMYIWYALSYMCNSMSLEIVRRPNVQIHASPLNTYEKKNIQAWCEMYWCLCTCIIRIFRSYELPMSLRIENCVNFILTCKPFVLIHCINHVTHLHSARRHISSWIRTNNRF